MAHIEWTERILKLFDKKDDLLIRIDHNVNTRIENVNVNIIVPSYTIGPKQSFRKNLKKLEDNCVTISDAKSGEIYKIRKLEAFDKIAEKDHLEPVVRMRALFSGFSTIRQPSDTDDMAVLELDEKSILLDMVEKGCQFKLILNLDILKAVSCGYSKEEIAFRIGDLCNSCDSLANKPNFNIVIDDLSYEPVWSLDDILIHRQMHYKDKSNYQVSFWDSNINEIKAFNSRFDLDFMHLESHRNKIFMMHNFSSIAEYIYFYSSQWIKNHPKVFD